ncbi:MAG: HU family DNA-binding protein [Pseudomonadota bacterium]
MAKKLAKKKSVATKTRKKAKVTSSKKIPIIKKPFTKTELLKYLVDSTELPKKKIVETLEIIQAVIFGHAKSACAFALPGVFKITVVKKGATKQRKGINPFNGEPTIFKAKPARKVVKIKALKKLKEVV